MQSTEDAGLQQGVRCFLSIDLVGSTGMKSNPEYLPTRKSAADPENQDWVDHHLKFYETCLDKVIFHDEGRPSSPWDFSNRLHFWRVRGDEVLFYSGRIAEPQQIHDILYAFCRTVKEIDKQLSDVGLGAKGCMWCAGFPIRNREMLISNSPPYFRSLSRLNATSADLEQAPFYDFGANNWLEFAGPEIDLGFILAPNVNASRTVVSLEVANFIAQCPVQVDKPIFIHHVGWRSLKTLLDGTPYPILWADVRQRPEPKKRVSFETALSDLSEAFFKPEAVLDAARIQTLNREYLADTKKYGRIDMYLRAKDAPAGDAELWERYEG